jgi:hypothetical protein
MEQLFSKSKYLNYQIGNKDAKENKEKYANNTPKDDKPDKDKIAKKHSYINMKKKQDKINISHDVNKLILNKLHNNFVVGMNSPVTNS